MTARLEGFFDKGYQKIFDGFGTLFSGLKPKIEKIGMDVRQELQKVENLCRQICPPNPNKKFVKLHYNLPINSQQTVVKVGKAYLNIKGSFPVFQRFLQTLIEYEAKKALEEKSSAAGKTPQPTEGAHTRLTEALLQTKTIVDDACSTMQTIKDFSNDLHNFRNALLLKEQTPDIIQQLARLEEMLIKLQSLALPSELNRESVEAFSKETWSIIASLQTEFDSMKSAPSHPLRKNVDDTNAIGQSAIASSATTQKIFGEILEAISQLRVHLFRLGQFKELLFKQDLSRFSTFEELRDCVKKAQELQEVIKQMELEVLVLMDRNPTSQNLQKEQVDLYKKDIDQLIEKHEAFLSSIYEKANNLTIPRPVTKPDAAPPAQPVSLIIFSPEIASFHQRRDRLIADQKEQLKSSLQAILEIKEDQNEMAPFREFIKDLIQIREIYWDHLNVEGQICSTEQDVRQWDAKFSAYKAVEEQICNLLRQDIQQGVMGGPIAQVKNLINQIRTLATSSSKVSLKETKTTCPPLQQLGTLISNPKLTFTEIKNILDVTNNAINQWAEQEQNQEVLILWKTLYGQLMALIGAAETFLKADAQNNQVLIAELSHELERFRYFKDSFVVIKYEEMINKINSIHQFNFEDPLNMLDNYVSIWNQGVLSIEKEKQSFVQLASTEESFDECLKSAQIQLNIWQETYQYALIDQLNKLISSKQADLDKRKNLVQNMGQIKSVIQVLKESTQQINQFISRAVFIPLPDLMESHLKTNPVLAAEIGHYYSKKLTEKVDQFENLLSLMRNNLSHEISEIQTSVNLLQEKLKHTKLINDPAETPFKEQLKCLSILKDLMITIERHQNSLLQFRQSSDFSTVTPEKLREYERQAAILITQAKNEIKEQIAKAPFVPFFQRTPIQLD